MRELLNFDRFIGIDWSGAENPGRGIQVAQCFPGNAVPQIVLNRDSVKWCRRDVLDWLVRINKPKERIIAGIDFAFAYPYCDEKAYFPGHKDSPKSFNSLWKVIDSICNPGDFYGGPFYKPPPFCDYLLYQTYIGERYTGRMRLTDNLCSGTPTSVFKCVGPESVGIGSIAGMRMLHHIKTHLNKDFRIWPFEKENNGRSLIVEIYPALFYKLSGQDSKEWANRETVNNILKHFGSNPLSSDLNVEVKDQIDAIVSAAAIRHLAGNPDTWQPSGLTECARTFEGWIFGVV